MESGALGRVYQDNETIIKQGDHGDSMYVIQEGLVEIIKETDQGDVLLALRGKGDFFGEMAIFEQEVRMATARAVGDARVLTVDKKNLIRRVNEDPSLALHLIQVMSSRIRELSIELSNLFNNLNQS